MLDILGIRHVAPAPDMNQSFAPRVNVITGDNGLAKTFVLDLAWWVVTQSWAGLPVVPGQGGPESTIRARLSTTSGDTSPSSEPAGMYTAAFSYPTPTSACSRRIPADTNSAATAFRPCDTCDICDLATFPARHWAAVLISYEGLQVE